MSEIVDTKEGSFRRVTDDVNKWWPWECPSCGERQSINLDQSEDTVRLNRISKNQYDWRPWFTWYPVRGLRWWRPRWVECRIVGVVAPNGDLTDYWEYRPPVN